MEIAKFNPTVAEIQAAILEVEGLTIAGIDDEAGYELVKAGRTKLGKMRTRVTNFGKEQRAEALAWQREVLRQEKELVAMIEPREKELKDQLDAIDEEKKRKEREILLPMRRKLVDEIEMKFLTDKFILDMDEKTFSAYYTEQKMNHEVHLQEEKIKAEQEVKRLEELEEAKKKAADDAVIAERKRAEKEKQDEQIRMVEANAKAEKDEKDRIEAEKKEQEKAEKNRKYKAWLKNHGYTEELRQAGEMHIIRDGNNFKLYKLVDQITI